MKYFLILFSAALMLCSCGKKELSLEETKELAQEIYKRHKSNVGDIKKLVGARHSIYSTGNGILDVYDEADRELFIGLYAAAAELKKTNLDKFESKIQYTPDEYRVAVYSLHEAVLRQTNALIDLGRYCEENLSSEEKMECVNRFKTEAYQSNEMIERAFEAYRNIYNELDVKE